MSRVACRLRAGLVLIALSIGVLAPAVAGEVRELRLRSTADATEAELLLSAQAEYKVFTLDNPARLVVDLRRSGLAPGFRADTSSGLVRGVRTGSPSPGDLRVVLDLQRGGQVRSFLEPVSDGGARLRIVLGGSDAAAAKTVRDLVPDSGRALIVAIDAGHGGQDPGARGARGTREKDITLAVARELARQVDAEPGFKAFLVRESDYFIPLQDRYRKARAAKADIFVSIHADAFDKATAAGSSVFVLSQRGASSEAARWLADRENAADLVGGVSLDDKDNTLAKVLLDLSQSATMRASEESAGQVLEALREVGKTHKASVERANFVVLRSPDVPSMLVETAFISNPTEERRLNDPAYRRRLATAVLSGLRAHFQTRPVPGTWLAARRAAAGEHLVARGDTLSGIAQMHGVSVPSLRAANGLDGDLLRVGQRLRIPAGNAQAASSVGAASLAMPR